MSGYDVIVAGGGAAGMMAAGAAAEAGARVLLVEKNSRLGRKLRITGKGRCNVTNHCTVQEVIANTPSNGRFLYGALSRFGPADMESFLENLGVPLKVERGNRVFPVSDKAQDIVDALESYVRRSGAEIAEDRVEELWMEDGTVRGAKLARAGRIAAESVILACGGLSYPGTGSTGDGYRLARSAGHTIQELRPSLVPLVAEDPDCAELQGLSLRNIAVRLVDQKKKKVVFEDFGELLFTHFGLSGPVILSASSHIREMEPGRYRILIDLKPGLTPEQLDARLLRDFEKNINRNFINSLDALLPRKLIPVAVRRSGIPPETKCNAVTQEQRRGFGGLLKAFSVTIKGFRPIAEAIVTSGGVSVKEVDPRTMESKKTRGLYLAGELLDVDAYTGGFNLQIAFSTGRLAGESAGRKGGITGDSDSD